MSEVKVFRVTGKILKPNFKTSFQKEVRALKVEHAVEEIYKELGSKHRVKRCHIKITNVEEVKPEDIEDPVIRRLTLEDVSYVK
ncbi:50S ribosomal protein L18a [Candidatus Bathyarchaeota archaeon]|nr:50S ribosomal protein L18a [Candidatus Bathyarchaeota archaeon]RJS83335.1 MAG: 50S ribosomal protein L18a [Candidatus Bathyarchaeota archaeon]